jgi:hypothetical protein
MDPRPTGMPSSWAASASWRLTRPPPSDPPVMQEMKNGSATVTPRKVSEVSRSPSAISGRALWEK